MKLKDLLTKYPKADLKVLAYTDFYDGSVDYSIPKDDLTIPNWAWPEYQNIREDYAKDIDRVVRNYVTPEAIEALDFEFDEYQFWHGAYHAYINGKTKPTEEGIPLPIDFVVCLILP